MVHFLQYLHFDNFIVFFFYSDGAGITCPSSELSFIMIWKILKILYFILPIPYFNTLKSCELVENKNLIHLYTINFAFYHVTILGTKTNALVSCLSFIRVTDIVVFHINSSKIVLFCLTDCFEIFLQFDYITSNTHYGQMWTSCLK